MGGVDGVVVEVPKVGDFAAGNASKISGAIDNSDHILTGEMILIFDRIQSCILDACITDSAFPEGFQRISLALNVQAVVAL